MTVMKKIGKIVLVLVFGVMLLNMTLVSKCDNTGHTTQISSSTNFNIIKINKDEMTFGVSNTKPDTADFYINSNFFNNSAIGLVVVEGLRYSNRHRGGGYFYVVNGKPHIASGFCPKMTQYASQTILWGIDNGIKNERLFQTRHGNLKRYRTIMGENSEGQIIVVSSSRIGLVTIKEIVDYAESLGMVEGILLDGGTSVDYKFSDDLNEKVFQSVPDFIKSTMNIKQPTTYIYGNFKNN
jgi:hypothetical protein